MTRFTALGFNTPNEDADEPLKGKPRAVRLDKLEYSLDQPVPSVTTETNYDPDGRVIDRRVYRADGTLSFHEAFQYEADPRVHTVLVLSAQGEVLSTRKIVAHPDGEESTVTNASGEVTEKTKTRRDSEGRVIAAVSEDTVRGHEIRMQVDYRAGRISYRDSIGRAQEFRPPTRHAIVQSSDAEGNWTSKTVVERGPSTGDEVVIASLNRTITYYSE